MGFESGKEYVTQERRVVDCWVSFDGLIVKNLGSDVGSLFQSIEAAQRKEQFEIFSLVVITGRARVMQFEDRVQLDCMEMRLSWVEGK